MKGKNKEEKKERNRKDIKQHITFTLFEAFKKTRWYICYYFLTNEINNK